MSHFRFPSTCIPVVFLRRLFCIYGVNLFYNALSFRRSTSRSPENHISIVLNKHFLYLVVVKFPRSFLLAIRAFFTFEPAKGLKISRYLIIDFRITGAKNIVRSSYQGPRYIEVHEILVLLLGGFLSTFSEQSCQKNPPLRITH